MSTSDIAYCIENYLRLMQAGDLKHEEICEIINMNPDLMESLLKMQQNQAFIQVKLHEFKMTALDLWNTVDKYIADGFGDEYIAEFLNIPVNQIAWRRHFKEIGIR